MEQLIKEFFHFEAFAEESDGNIAPLSIWISQPDFDETRGYFCLVTCAFVRAKPFFIFGVDEDQARYEAFKFIRSLVFHKSERLVDGVGLEIILEEDAPFNS